MTLSQYQLAVGVWALATSGLIGCIELGFEFLVASSRQYKLKSYAGALAAQSKLIRAAFPRSPLAAPV